MVNAAPKVGKTPVLSFWGDKQPFGKQPLGARAVACCDQGLCAFQEHQSAGL